MACSPRRLNYICRNHFDWVLCTLTFNFNMFKYRLNRVLFIYCLFLLMWPVIGNCQSDLGVQIEKGKGLSYSDPEKALGILSEVLDKLENNQDSLKAATFNGIGTVHYINGNYPLALKWYYESLELQQKIKDKLGIAVGMNNVGIVLTAQGKIDKAIDIHLRSAEICKEINDTLALSRNYYNLGISYIEKKEFEKAESYLLEALKGGISQKSEIRITQSYNQLGVVNYAMGNYLKSIEYHTKILDDPMKDNDWETCFAYYGISLCHNALKNISHSIAYADSGIIIAERLNAKFDIQNLSFVLAQAHEANRDFEKAFYYLQLHKTYHDSLWNEERDREINNLQLISSEKIRKNLEQKNIVQAELLERRSEMLLGSVISLLVIIILLLMIVRSSRNKSRLNSDLKSLNNEIQVKNNQLSEVINTRDKLYAIVAHDLRGPLGTNANITSLLLEELDSFDTDELKEMIAHVNQSSVQTYNLLVDLLDWANLQTGNVIFNPQELDFNNEIAEVFAIVTPSAIEKKIQLLYSSNENCNVFADQQMLSAILRNLINNAIKFTQPSGRVDVIYRKEAMFTTIEIKDTGVGMNKDQARAIFKKGDVSTTLGTNKEKGSGLGSLVIQEFVKWHKGKIEVESMIGRGTSIIVYFPIKIKSE